MKNLIDFNHPFYRPPGVRIAIVALAVGWGLFEILMGALVWGALFIGIGAVAGWRFATIDYSPPE